MIISNEKIIRYKHGSIERVADTVICEEWFKLYLNNRLIYQTPVLDQEIDDLIYGFLYVGGQVKKGEKLDIKRNGRSWYVTLGIQESARSTRLMVEEALAVIESGTSKPTAVESGKYRADGILNLMRELQKLPSVYHKTGGVHMAAFATDRILYWADDISRRNSMDKVIGKVFKSDTNFQDGIFVSSGRISSDIVIRMIKTGVELIASVSAPMDKAIRLAEYYGITLCGFARGGRMNIYTNDKRVITD